MVAKLGSYAEEHMLYVFTNGRQLFWSVACQDETTGQWRTLHNIELCDLCWSPSIVRALMGIEVGCGEKGVLVEICLGN